MTAMCVLSKISGLQDKIRASDEDHDVIVGRTERDLKSPRAEDRGEKIVRACEKIGDDLPKSDKDHRYTAERESPDGNELNIKIGLQRTFMGEGIGYKRGRRDVADIIRHLKNDSIISVGQINPNECTEELRDDKDDGHDRGYCVSTKSPLPAVPPKGIGPILQHWESMIGRKVSASESSKYPSDEMQMIDDNAGEKIITEAIPRSKSSQFPSRAELLGRERAAGINTLFNNEHSIIINNKNNKNKNRGCDAALATSRGGKLKRMALELLDILVANKKTANDVPASRTTMGSGSDATRVKTIYRRIPNYEKGVKDRRIHHRTEIHGDCGNTSRTDSTSRLSESTRGDAINYADTCTDAAAAAAAQCSLQNKPSAGRVTPMELYLDDWLMRELRSRQGIRLQL